ncbi:hypothetical protein ACW2QC_17600 [Virgibacillus sp. FSP13]
MIDDKVKERIEQLDETDAKAMLKIIYGFVETAVTGNGGDEMIKECVDKVSNFYKSIPDIKELDGKE